MKFSAIILESKVDEFKNRFSQKFSPEQLEAIVKKIKPKYFDWIGKNLSAINFDNTLQNVATALDDFTKFSSNLVERDINQYKSIDDLVTTMSNYKNRIRRDYQIVNGANVVYDDGRFLVVNPLSHESSCYFGSGTKWCTAASTSQHFNNYNDDGKLFYILDRTKPTRDPSYKIAVLKKFDGGISIFDAEDVSFKENILQQDENYKLIGQKIDEYLKSEYSEQIQLFSDKERARKEKDRLERLREERRVQELRNQAEQRRLNDEWALGPDCPTIGLMAHAIKEYLESEGDGVDLYNIIPMGDWGDHMKSFEVIDSGLDGKSFMCGDEYDTTMTAYNSQLSILEDIGIEGINKNFLYDFVDRQAVIDTATEFYEQDVWENPEAYLNENSRELSQAQILEISRLQKQIENYEKAIELYEEKKTEQNKEKYEQKIEEFKSFIEDFTYSIEDIQSSPEGEYNSNDIEIVVDDMVQYVKKDYIGFINDFGLDINNFIDFKALAKGIVDEDGVGPALGTYDGEIYDYRIQNQIFYVGRID